VWWSSHRPGGVSRFGDRGLPKPLAAARPPITAGQEPLDTRPTPPSPGRRPTRRPSGSTGLDGGAWGYHWSRRLLADQLGISHSTVAWGWAEHDGKPCRPRPSGSPPTRGWRPASATWSGCPWSRRRTRSCCVDETSQIQALLRADAAGGQRRRGGAKAGCAPATHRAVEGVADDRLGGGAAGLSTPQEVMPVKRSCTAVRPPVRRGRPGSWLPRTTKGSLEQ
jgi:hypothetical protein